MNYTLYKEFLKDKVISEFHKKCLESLKDLDLKKVLLGKNPYLFKAKNIASPRVFVMSILDAYLSSQEETIFGNLLEAFAICVSEDLYGGFKSSLKSIDLEFERDGKYYVVSIKSGIKWANSDQQNKMMDNFKIAKNYLCKEKGITSKIIAINGCMYGREGSPFKNSKKHNDPEKAYYKLTGQMFWEFISNNKNFYTEVITLLDEGAIVNDAEYDREYERLIEMMTANFSKDFVTNGQIDWVKVTEFVCKQREPMPSELLPGTMLFEE